MCMLLSLLCLSLLVLSLPLLLFTRAALLLVLLLLIIILSRLTLRLLGLCRWLAVLVFLPLLPIPAALRVRYSAHAQ